jgi:DnaK suppressor protein
MEILSRERDILVKELDASRDNTSPILLDQSAQGRVTRADAMQQQTMAIAMVERKKLALRKIDAALARCHSGTYGICCACGDVIPRERLTIDLSTPFCLECLIECQMR